jgi:acetolactate synthase-1/3 small subunit
MIGRELILIKVSANARTRQDIINVCQIMGGKVDDVSPTTMTLELTDTTEKVDMFLELMRPFSILEVARTGLAALQKGNSGI